MKRWSYNFRGDNRVEVFNEYGVNGDTIEEAAAAIRARHGIGEIISIHMILRRAQESMSSVSVATHSEAPVESGSKQ